MRDFILFAVYLTLFGQTVLGAMTDERQCSRYHYDAQILERIIKAEIVLADVKSDVATMEEIAKKDKQETNDRHTELDEKIDKLQQEFNNFVKNITNFKEEKDLLTACSMRQFCTTSDSCSDVENAECKWMQCKCKPGLSYHHASRKCLPDCGDKGYGNTYQVEMDTVLYGFSTYKLTTISLEDCVKRCSTEKRFVCRTVEYEKAKQICYLSWETLYTNPKSHRKNYQDYVTYTRDCN